MSTAKTLIKIANPVRVQTRRSRSEMNEFGRKMADVIEKSEASGEKRMSMEEIEREVIRRRGGIYK